MKYNMWEFYVSEFNNIILVFFLYAAFQRIFTFISISRKTGR